MGSVHAVYHAWTGQRKNGSRHGIWKTLYSIRSADPGEYDERFSICDDLDIIATKLNSLLHNDEEEEEEKDNESDTLSQREKEIVTCVVKGMTNKAIADKLFLSIHTVITHRRNIARKLQIHSPAGLTIYAIVNKLVELSDIKEKL